MTQAVSSRSKGVTISPIYLFVFMALALIFVGVTQSWSYSLKILNMCLISAIMALGVNIQWGYAGLLNVGVMGFTALGGLAAVLVSMSPVAGAWEAGGSDLIIALALIPTVIIALFVVMRKVSKRYRGSVAAALGVGGYFLIRAFLDPATARVEAYEASLLGYLGGLGLPILFSWLVGGLFAAGAAWCIGKISLGLRSDYLAIATLGISEIIIALLKHEDWLTRGVKNVSGLPRPVPYEIDLQQSLYFQSMAESWGVGVQEMSSIVVKLCYAGLFIIVLAILLYLSEKALRSPWGRMMRAIRDNEHAASAMGKYVKGRHLQVFILGSAVIGIAGAMMTTLDGQLTPGAYQPLRYTFMIWVMVIIGGSGSNWGSVLGGFIFWFFWVVGEPLGNGLMDFLTSGLGEESPIREHLMNSVAYMRYMLMGVILILVLRFAPKGLIPER